MDVRGSTGESSLADAPEARALDSYISFLSATKVRGMLPFGALDPCRIVQRFPSPPFVELSTGLRGLLATDAALGTLFLCPTSSIPLVCIRFRSRASNSRCESRTFFWPSNCARRIRSRALSTSHSSSSFIANCTAYATVLSESSSRSKSMPSTECTSPADAS